MVRWILLVGIALMLVFFGWQASEQNNELTMPERSVVLRELREPAPSLGHSLSTTPPEEEWSQEEFDAALLPPPELSPDALVDGQSLRLIADIAQRISVDLEEERYGEAGTLSYNMIFLMHQSLIAFHRYLQYPSEGPDLHVLMHREFSGRYQFYREKILLGQKTLQQGEGRYLVTLFHEYQHYLFHTIYGTPPRSDIVRKFYNELAAHIFGAIFSTYLPRHYFQGGTLSRYTVGVQRRLLEHKGYEAIDLTYDLMVPRRNRAPMYSFLLPTAFGYIDKRELVESIDERFHPNPEIAENLQEIAAEYFVRRGT